MADYESRWRNDQDYRRDDDRDRWRSEGRDSMSGRHPGYGYEGHGREGYDYGRDYWRQSEGRERGSYGQGYGQGYGSQDDRSRDYGYGDEARGDYGQDFGSRGMHGGFGRSDYGRSQYGQSDYGRSGYGGQRGSGYRDSDYGRRQEYRDGYDDRGFRDRYYAGQSHGSQDYGGRNEDRGYFERAGDEMASWFGDDDAARRREMDARRGDAGAQHHRGRGPRGYTRSDDRIREDVSDRLTDDPYIDASEIDITVSNCEVTLSGTVDDRRAKRRAEDVVETISGVRHVQNNLRVRHHTHGGSGTTAGASAMAGLGTSGTSSMSGTAGTTGTTTASTTRMGTGSR